TSVNPSSGTSPVPENSQPPTYSLPPPTLPRAPPLTFSPTKSLFATINRNVGSLSSPPLAAVMAIPHPSGVESSHPPSTTTPAHFSRSLRYRPQILQWGA